MFFCFAFFSFFQFICSFRHICFFSLSQFRLAFGFVFDCVCSVLLCPVKGRCCWSVYIPSQVAPPDDEHLMGVWGELNQEYTQLWSTLWDYNTHPLRFIRSFKNRWADWNRSTWNLSWRRSWNQNKKSQLQYFPSRSESCLYREKCILCLEVGSHKPENQLTSS